ncbi:Extracellular endo-alpha-(1-_5)-L-arabinanase 1 [Fusarium oxysporum f. sp. rapae]|uniref:Endo-1,5-alpha-L-arabinanase A n=1 Tax=Fusarium oxysporum f. sp. rapae TaxID=485398 RepID=A0A8J5TQ64_FUSOX|nr:Extracellular endo-alpha-(1->5)-L-arabinanase 1 [Fusarium oxysporum f. sp. rapae]
MFKFIVSGLAALAMAPAVNAQYPNPGPVSGNTFTHDPTVAKTPSSGYLMAFFLPTVSASKFPPTAPGGLKLVELDPTTGKRKGTGMTSIAARPNNGGELEAPFITKRGNYYYLWTSFDRCCKGKDSTYRIMVGRATNIKGPYVDKSGKQMMQGSGNQIIAGHGQIRGPGHNAVVTDNNTDVLVYHYFDATRGDARIDINLLRYDNGWPVAY